MLNNSFAVNLLQIFLVHFNRKSKKNNNSDLYKPPKILFQTKWIINLTNY